MNKPIRSIILSLLILGISLPALAEAPAPQNQKKIRENISTLMLLRMTSALDLSEEQTAKIFPKVNATEKEKQDIQREISRETRQLRAALQEEKPDEPSLLQALGTIRDLRRQLRALDEELTEFLDANLSVVQRAKYVFFAQDFARILREQLDRARKVQPKKKRIPQRF